MRICFIGKYPPIQGGVSRVTFWASYALLQEGFDVHIVTNAKEVEYQYKIFEAYQQNDPLADLSLKKTPTVHYSSQFGKHMYIPWANPFVTKLAAIATEVIERYNCQLLYSYYLEPYALAAYLASQWTGVPYGICTAGSDVGRLFQHHDLQTTYKKIIQSADYVFTSHNLFRRFLYLGVDMERLYPLVRESLPTNYFNPSTQPLEMDKLLNVIKSDFSEENYQGILQSFATKLFEPSLPTIGIYGKVGQVKGSFDLLKALSFLKTKGLKFNFLAISQGNTQTVLDFAKNVREYGLEDVTWLLPFIPHWSIPSFIRRCTAVCFLERNFPIPIHSPTIPREVFACGTCLILSKEVANKATYLGKLRQNANVLLVDPTDINELAATLKKVIENPSLSREIGMCGYQEISTGQEDFQAYSHDLAASFTSIWQDIQFRRSVMSITEIQACLARLYIDDSFRKIFFLEPDKAISDYKLTEQEKDAVKGIDHKMLDYFANSLIAKRGKSFQSAYPLLYQLIGPEFNRYFKRFYHLFPAKPKEAFLQQILSFGEFMEQSLAGDEDVPPYASDLARYERFCYSSKFSPWPRDSFEKINENDQPQPSAVDLSSYLCGQPGVQIATFTYNIVKIASDLQQQKELEEVQKGSHCLVFQQVANSLAHRIFAISLTTRDLLSLCDGSHRVSEIVESMECKLGKESLEDDILRVLRHLSSLSIIRSVIR